MWVSLMPEVSISADAQVKNFSGDFCTVTDREGSSTPPPFCFRLDVRYRVKTRS
jgi:hypothetical protein